MKPKTKVSAVLDKTLGAPQSFLSFRLARLHAKLSAQATRILSEHAGITLTEWRVIAMIGSRDQLTLTEIHRETQLDKGQLSRCIQKMIRNNMLSVTNTDSDLRQQLLSLSTKGARIYRQTLPRMQARQAQLSEHLSDKEKRVVFEAIAKLEQAVDTDVSYHTR